MLQAPRRAPRLVEPHPRLRSTLTLTFARSGFPCFLIVLMYIILVLGGTRSHCVRDFGAGVGGWLIPSPLVLRVVARDDARPNRGLRRGTGPDPGSGAGSRLRPGDAASLCKRASGRAKKFGTPSPLANNLPMPVLGRRGLRRPQGPARQEPSRQGLPVQLKKLLGLGFNVDLVIINPPRPPPPPPPPPSIKPPQIEWGPL